MEPPEKQSPVRQSLCGSLRRDGHWKCFCLTFLIVVCLTAISWCKITHENKSRAPLLDSPFSTSDQLGPCKEGYIYIPVAFVIMLYLVYLVECWHSHTRLELKYKVDMPTVYRAISDMQSSLPVIWWKSTCYHYVRRTRRVMRYRNGDAFSSTQVYYERVDSSTAGAAFNFTQCGVKDISRPINNLEKFQAIKIKISKGFSFANVETEYEFEEQRSQFFQDYETRDDYMEGREGMDLMNVDFLEYIIAFTDPNRLPWYVSHSAFWIASSLLLSWPLRTLIEYKTAHLHYHIHKLFGSNYVDSENYPNLMTRVNTMNSEDLEMSIRNNNVIVPSYSEAMLNNAFEMQTIRDYGAIATKSTQKFPRSLTNVTLAAARGSSNVISNTPAFTMNQVKRFNSCSAFGDPAQQSSSEALSNPGTIRRQLSQLFRDRQIFNNNKRKTRSSVSVAGFPFSSRDLNLDRTPDGIESIRSSFSTYSVTSARRQQSNTTTNNDATITANGRNSVSSLRRNVDSRRSIAEICYRNNNNSNNNNSNDTQTTASRSSSSDNHRPSSVSLLVRSSVDMNSPSSVSLSYHTVSNDSPAVISTHPIPIPLQLSSSSSPPPLPGNPHHSPPDYDVALRTCQVADHPSPPPTPPRSSTSTSSAVTAATSQSIHVVRDNNKPRSNNNSQSSSTQNSRDRTTTNGETVPKRPTTFEPITNSSNGASSVHNNNRSSVVFVNESGFNCSQNYHPTPLTTSSPPPPTSSSSSSSSSTTTTSSSSSSSCHRGLQFKLKSLPKVTVPLVCNEVDDYDDVGAESDDVDNNYNNNNSSISQQQGGWATPNSISSRDCQFHAGGVSDGELLPSTNPNLSGVTLIQEHSTIGLSYGRGTGNGEGNERSCSSPIRMETSV